MTAKNSSTSGNGSREGFYRVWDIIGCKQRRIPPLVPMGKSTFWKRVADGDFPPPIKLSKKMSVWRKTDVHDWIDRQ